MLIFGLAAMAAAAAAEPARDWRATARADVLAAYDVYAANHPGMKDPTNPGFRAHLATARDAALKLADKAKDLGGYRDALAAFSAGLADGHAVVFSKVQVGDEEVEWLWPGFVTAWRGKGLFVHFAAPTSPVPVGTAIVSCDGMSTPDLVRARLRFMPFRPAEAGQWWRWAQDSFELSTAFRQAQPHRCTFRLPNGEVREVPLTWNPVPRGFPQLMSRARAGEGTQIGLSEPRPGLFLVGLPTFNPNDDGVKAYQALYAELARRHAGFQRARAIVLDLRFNNGGSSEWSAEIARRLWGKEAVDRRMDDYYRPVRIWWRASPGNVAYMTELEAKVRHNGQTAAADEVHTTAAGMKTALDAGRDFYIEATDKASPARTPLPSTDLRTPVYVITWGACASACLDALDTFKRFPNVKLIGSPTSADSNYMEVRSADLPSGQGRIVIPLKIWMHRPRGAGVVYLPDIRMNGLDWSTNAFLDRIEQDVSAHH